MRVQILSVMAAVFVFCLMTYVHIGLEVRLNINFDGNRTRPCGCNRCIVELIEDQWFNERFKRDVPVLLNRKSYNLSGSTKRWWTRLHYRNGRSNRNFDKIKDSLFSLFPDEVFYNDSSHKRCRLCAVVGNSANLNGSHYGPLIDAHDLVIRMNQGPTKGFEKDVGSRTTHRAIYPVSAMDMDNATHLVLLPFSTRDLEWLQSAFTTKHINRTHTAVRSSIQANKDMVMILNPGFMQYVHAYWLKGKGKFPSTGFIMLVFSLHICDQVNVFGFGADQKGRWLHYFDTTHRIKPNAGNHRGSMEHDIIMELHRKKKITVFRGW